MPEKPEVVTVSRVLEKRIVGKKIIDCHIYWDNIIVGDPASFIEQIKYQEIERIETRGKWLIIFLTTKALLIHLRMEGKFFFRTQETARQKHEHVIFTFEDGMQMRFHDVRKFGKMLLLPKQEVFELAPLNQLGYEFGDQRLTAEYLLSCFHRKSLPIKTVLLDQSIIAGIGNIYDDEILFASQIHPLTKAKDITLEEAEAIIKNTKQVLAKAIKKGGTTIRSFTSSEGVHGLFQNELAVHGKSLDSCPVCGGKIQKIKVGGRGTYYCPNCQKQPLNKIVEQKV